LNVKRRIDQLKREQLMSLPVYLKKDDQEKILSPSLVLGPGAKNDRNRLMVRLMLRTGMRVGEISRLRVEDLVDLDKQVIYVRKSKGGNDRIVLADPETAKILRQFSADRTSGPIFGIKPHAIQHIVKKMARTAGVRNADLMTPHKLRHSFAINWVQHGGDIESLRRLLGHKSLATTQIYLNFDFDTLLGVFNRLMQTQDRRMI